jgi:hypothetical protein
MITINESTNLIFGNNGVGCRKQSRIIGVNIIITYAWFEPEFNGQHKIDETRGRKTNLITQENKKRSDTGVNAWTENTVIWWGRMHHLQ